MRMRREIGGKHLAVSFEPLYEFTTTVSGTTRGSFWLTPDEAAAEISAFVAQRLSPSDPGLVEAMARALDFGHDLASKQEPLGKEFAEVLTPDLYVRSDAAREEEVADMQRDATRRWMAAGEREGDVNSSPHQHDASGLCPLCWPPRDVPERAQIPRIGSAGVPVPHRPPALPMPLAHRSSAFSRRARQRSRELRRRNQPPPTKDRWLCCLRDCAAALRSSREEREAELRKSREHWRAEVNDWREQFTAARSRIDCTEERNRVAAQVRAWFKTDRARVSKWRFGSRDRISYLSVTAFGAQRKLNLRSAASDCPKAARPCTRGVRPFMTTWGNASPNRR
jgi:hypothetical protein